MNGKVEVSPDSKPCNSRRDEPVGRRRSDAEESTLSKNMKQLNLIPKIIQKDMLSEAYENGMMNDERHSSSSNKQYTEHRSRTGSDRSNLTLPTSNPAFNGVPSHNHSSSNHFTSHSSTNHSNHHSPHLLQAKSPHNSSKLHDDDYKPPNRIRDAITPSPHRSEINRAEMKSDVLAELSQCYRGILASVGEDTKRQGLLKTPERAAKAMLYFTKGYDEDVSGRFFGVFV